MWIEAGFSPDTFWGQTPRLFHIAVAAKGRAAEAAHKGQAWQAWQIASLSAYSFHSPAKMPSLESLTTPRRAARVQTPEEMKAVFAAMRKRKER